MNEPENHWTAWYKPGDVPPVSCVYPTREAYEHMKVSAGQKPHAADWTVAEIAEWKRAYAEGRPVETPWLEHQPGECGHCDLLRLWAKEADDDA